VADRLRPSWRLGLAGVLPAAAGLGVAELGAAVRGPDARPVVAMADVVIGHVPAPVRDYAIRTLGTADKPLLVVGVLVVLAVAAVALAVVAQRRPAAGWLGVGALAALAAGAVLLEPDTTWVDTLPTLAGALVAGSAMHALLRRLPAGLEGDRGRAPLVARPAAAERAGSPTDTVQGAGPADEIDGTDRRAPEGHAGAAASETLEPDGRAAWSPGSGRRAGSQATVDRRGFLRAAGGTAAVAVAAGGAARLLDRRQAAADASRAAVTIPAPASPAPAVPPGVELSVPGVPPFLTPPRRFYRVDTALVVPALRADRWSLRVHGMVDRELRLSFADLLARPLIERDITLNCVSNEVGGPYISTGRWVGAPLGPLLAEARIRPGADQVVSRSADGFTAGTPVATVLDGRDAMLAVALDGEPLPLEHGFPVRMLVPGLYGYVSATKWLVELELSTFAGYDAYWVRRGWAPRAPVKTASRIDTPGDGARVRAGPVTVAGVAWAQHRGIRRVEVRVDSGDWRHTELAAADGVDTWRQWRWAWDAGPGRHVLEVRATDGTGAVQTGVQRPPTPDGATGWHAIHVTVR